MKGREVPNCGRLFKHGKNCGLYCNVDNRKSLKGIK